MPKRIRGNEQIYLAPDILGKYENGKPIAIDERNDNERLNPRDLDDKIKIYEREVEEWFLNPVSKMLGESNFIVLMVCMSYLEGVEQYKTGIESTRRSKNCFVDSLKRLYPNKFRDRHLEKLYNKSRCGLFHNGMVKGGVILDSAFEEALKFEDDGETIKVNPVTLLNDIKNDFKRYIKELKTTNNGDMNSKLKTLRENFDRMFTVL